MSSVATLQSSISNPAQSGNGEVRLHDTGRTVQGAPPKGVMGRLWKNIRPSIPLNSISQYYGLMRLVGYVYEMVYKDLTSAMTKDMDSPALGWLEDKGVIKEGGPFTKSYNKIFHTLEEARAKKVTNFIEAGTFVTLTVLTAISDRKNLIADFAEAEAISRGTTPDKIGLLKLMRSKNPVINSALDRFTFQNTFRLISDAAFAKSLRAGIILKALDITFERSAFVDKDVIAYDKIKGIISEVQSNNFGDTIKDDAARKLVAAFQSAKRDHLDVVVSQDQIIALQPVFEEIAQAVVDQTISTPGVVHLLGGNIIKPEDAELSLNNVRQFVDKAHLAKHGTPRIMTPAIPELDVAEVNSRTDDHLHAVEGIAPNKVHHILKNGQLRNHKDALSESPASVLEAGR